MRLLMMPFLLPVILACTSPRPSPEYDRAVALWSDLVRADPDAAAEDPRSDAVLEHLGRVPPDSSDANAAATLRLRIQSERREHAAERSRREEVLRRAATPAPPVAETVAIGGARTDAAGAGTSPVLSGMEADAFRAAYSSCFAPAGNVAVTPAGGPARPGEIWSMKDDPPCRQKHPGLVGQVVVLADGVVAGVRPATAVRRFEVQQQAELATLPDGRPGMILDGKLVPLPEGARVVRTERAGAPP